MRSSLLIILLLLTAGTTVAAQGSKADVKDDKCAGRIYQHNEVTQRPKFGNRDVPTLTSEAKAHGVSGRVLLNAVLCRTGKVTDITVVEGLPYGVTEKAIEAARNTQFQPAEINGRTVSAATQFDYHFSYIGERRPLAKEPIAGRLIEGVEINSAGNKPLDDILKMLKTRVSEPFNGDVVKADLRALLGLGLDPVKTTVRVEEGVRGGVNVVFELYEKNDKR